MMRGRRRLAAIALLLPFALSLAGCGGDDPPTPPKSDGLLRSQDLSNLDPTDTQENHSEDSSRTWPCTGTEEDALRNAGWTSKSRSYSNAEEHWALSTTLWRNDAGNASQAMAALQAAVDLCRSKGENTRQTGSFNSDFYTYETFGKTGRLEGERGYTTAGDHLIAQVTLVGLDGQTPPRAFGDVLENSTRRAETVQKD